VVILNHDELAALLATCKGNSFENRRDTAILRLLIHSGIRAGEIAGLGVADLDSKQDVSPVLGMGSGVPYVRKTADALRRYRRTQSAPPS